MTIFTPITKSHLISKFSVSDALLVYNLSVLLLSCSDGDQRIDHSEMKVKANSKKERRQFQGFKKDALLFLLLFSYVSNIELHVKSKALGQYFEEQKEKHSS